MRCLAQHGTPANPTRFSISLFARSIGSGPWGWAIVATFFQLDIANAYWLMVKSIRTIAGKRPVGWWTGKDYRGKSVWKTRLNHAVHPAIAAFLAFPFSGVLP